MDPLGCRHNIEELSADAAFLFTNGRVREASLSWHGVVQRLLPLVTSELSVNSTLTYVPASPLQGAFAILPMDTVDASMSSKLTSEDRTFSLYASAIRYVPRRWGGDDPDAGGGGLMLDDDMAMAATAVYNLGLCHHVQALVYENRAPELCEKALRAYAASQRILEGSGLCYVYPRTADAAAASERHHKGIRVLQLALANNMGHVYDQLHRRDEAQYQLLALHGLVATLDFDDGDGRIWTVHDATPLVPFLLTTTMYPSNHKICLPAPSA